MYHYIAMAVIGVGGAIAGAVWKARSKDKEFLDQLKSLQPKDKPIIVVETTNGKKTEHSSSS